VSYDDGGRWVAAGFRGQWRRIGVLRVAIDGGRNWGSRASVLAGLLVMVVLLWPTVAHASLSWSGPVAVDKDGGTTLNSVACPSAGQCTAVDQAGQEVTFDPGSPGTATPVEIHPGDDPGHVRTSPFGGVGTPPNALEGVACPALTQCTAVDQNGDEVTFDPANPQIEAVVPIASALVAVACPSVHQCTAITATQELTFDPTSPGKAQPITIDLSGLVALSCPSATQCTAIDSQAGITTFNPTTSGSSWSPTTGQGLADTIAIACPSARQCTAVGDGAEETFDPTAIGNPEWDDLPLSSLDLSDVSCPSTTQCTATDTGGQAVTFNPAASAAAQILSVGPGTSLACPSSGQCAEVGVGGEETTFAPTSNGSPSPVAIDSGNDLSGVWCPAQDQCVAVDEIGQTVSFDPGSPGSPTPTASIESGPLDGVDCPGVDQCAAVGVGSGPQHSDFDAEVNFDPTTPPSNLTYTGGPGLPVTAVSCPSSSQCTTVFGDGTEQTFNPASPDTSGAGVTIDADAGLGAVSCPTVDQCTAMDDTGQEVTFDPGTGTLLGSNEPFREEVGDDFPFFVISCPSSSQCTVVDGSDQDVTFNPQQPVFPVWVTIDPGAKVDGLSCPTLNDCVAVDDIGQALEGDPTATGPWTFEPFDSGDLLTAVECSSTSQCVAVDQDGNAFVGAAGGSPPAASPPTVLTDGASAVTSSVATLAGIVNPNGDQVTDCELQYGTDTSYEGGVPVPCATSPGAGKSPVGVSAELSGLVSGTTYQYRFVAQNAAGRTYGASMSFTTLPGPRAPVVVTGGPLAVRAHQALLSGSINPDGARLTDCELQWGSDAAYENVPMPCDGAIGAGNRAVPVRGGVFGLSPDTTYHYRFVAENEIGRAYGIDRTFTTRPGHKATHAIVLLSTVPAARYAQSTNVLSPAANHSARLRLYAYTITRQRLVGLRLRIQDGARTTILRTDRVGTAIYRVAAGPARTITIRYAGDSRYAPTQRKIRIRPR
jgi:hypothetical protein